MKIADDPYRWCARGGYVPRCRDSAPPSRDPGRSWYTARMRRPGSASELERVRLIAANMFGQGLKTAQVAASLSVDDQTVRRWRRVYDARGAEGLRSRPHPGGR